MGSRTRPKFGLSDKSRPFQVLLNLQKTKSNLPSEFYVTQKKSGVTLFLSSSCFFFCSFSFSLIFSAIFFFSETFGSVKGATTNTALRGLNIFFSPTHNHRNTGSHRAQLLGLNRELKTFLLNPALAPALLRFDPHTPPDTTSVCSDADTEPGLS